jgi:hypothetical protein
LSIDTDEVESPGWWMKRLAAQLTLRRKRLEVLDAWYRGEPPIDAKENPHYAKHADITRQSRTNFAMLSVKATRQRMRVRAIRTSVDADLEGDEEALAIWKANRLPVESATCHRFMLTFGVGYTIVGMPRSGDMPLITVEDPREVITAHDHRTGEVVAALKLTHDDTYDRDMAYLWLPGELHVAVKDRRATPATINRAVSFSSATFSIDEDLGEEFDPAFGVPVVPFENDEGRGLFEPHLGLLERIDRGTFRRDTIALLQAFRQRAVKGDLPETDERGDIIDYDDLFAADPGALWQLPEGVDLWESGQVDLTPLQVSKRDDVKEFAAVTFTPLSMITPDAAAQSAEGASLQREGLVFQVEDCRERAGASWARTKSLAFAMRDQPERANLEGIVIDWMPAERHSLESKGNAANAAKNSGVPWRTIMSDIWGFDPEKVERMRDERDEDLLYALGTAGGDA